MIESGNNGQIKRIKKLKKNARFRKKEASFVVEGWKMTEEAMRCHLVKQIYLAQKAQSEYVDRLAQGKMPEPEERVTVEILTDSLFQELSDTVTPQGILAVAAIPEYDRSDLISGQESVFLCLEDIQDPGNLGTMFRTAEGSGVTAVVLSEGCVDLFNPKVVRSTMGSIFRVPYYWCSDMAAEVEKLKIDDYTIYAAHLRGESDYTEERYRGRVAILIGNEAKGLSDSVSVLADKKVKIHMEGELESLNASVSAALLMYEVHRNRK